MTVEAKVQPGDWVRFQYNNGLVIGVVQYVRGKRWAVYDLEAVTDVGTVDVDRILEVRRG